MNNYIVQYQDISFKSCQLIYWVVIITNEEVFKLFFSSLRVLTMDECKKQRNVLQQVDCVKRH